MGFPPRVCFEGAIYHIMARGDNRERVFRDRADYEQYLTLLRAYQERFHFSLHAYALMPNHLHLILQPAPDATVSKIMQCLTVRFTKYINRRHKRVGHVFQGRFRSPLITEDAYLLVASRYVHLNPVRASLVESPLDYPWSSYGAYMGRRRARAPSVECGLILSLVAPEGGDQRAAYREFVEGPSARQLEAMIPARIHL